jgi:hypothetical protein
MSQESTFNRGRKRNLFTGDKNIHIDTDSTINEELRVFNRLPARPKPINVDHRKHIFIKQIHERRELCKDAANGAVCKKTTT